MKKLLYLSLLFLGIAFAQPSSAQVSVSINIGSQPLWGPVGYDYVRYYYIPAIDVYYDVMHHKYTYFQGNKWVSKSKLPGRYRNFDLYRTHKVVINSSSPWNNHRYHRQEYAKFASYHNQVVLRDVHTKRSVSKDVKHYKKMKKNQHRNHR